MTCKTAHLIAERPWGPAQGACATPSVGGSGPADLVECLFYHTARSIEELDRARASTGSAACRAHEQLAFLHLKAASRLKRNGLSDIVAEWVD